jgi:hypothetical protein
VIEGVGVVTLQERRWLRRVTRDAVLFTIGLAGIVHETLFATVERPYLLMLFAACIGLPVFRQLDADRRRDGE